MIKERDAGGYVDANVAELYDYNPRLYVNKGVDYYVSEAVASGGPVLELGCGTGRILIPIARKGIEITGLDLSEAMLKVLGRRLADEPEEVRKRVHLFHADMIDFRIDAKFVLIIIPFRPLQHLVSVEEHLACLRCANRCLTTKGRIAFDVYHPNPRGLYDPAWLKESEDFADVALPDGRKLRRAHRIVAFHRAQQYNDVEYYFDVTGADGRVERTVQAFPFRYFFRYEVEHLLARCGFRIVDLFGAFDRSAFGDDSPEMIFVADKCGDV